MAKEETTIEFEGITTRTVSVSDSENLFPKKGYETTVTFRIRFPNGISPSEELISVRISQNTAIQGQSAAIAEARDVLLRELERIRFDLPSDFQE